MKLLTFFVTLTLMSLVSTIKADPIYTFESLTPGNLPGQDNWVNASTPANVSAHLVTTGPGINTTKVGQVNTGVFDFVLRKNDMNYSYPAYTGSETSALMEFDVSGADVNNIGVYMGLYKDLNNNSTINANEFGPQFGFRMNGAAKEFFIYNAGLNSFQTAPLTGVTNAATDWYRVAMRTDFVANSGNGSASLYFKNLTDGASNYTPVGGLQNVNVSLTSGPAPSLWDAITVRGDGGGYYDNLNPVSTSVIPAAAIFGTYVDAVANPANGSVNTTPASAFPPGFTYSGSFADNLWDERVVGGAINGALIEGGPPPTSNPDDEELPVITTSVNVPLGSYDVYVLYYDFPGGTNWGLRASLNNPNPTQIYSGTDGVSFATGLFGPSGASLRQALLGQVLNATSFSVSINNAAGTDRTWYEGISYQLVPEPSSVIICFFGLPLFCRFRGRRYQ